MFVKNNFIVFTGGPGAGKTSLIEALSQKGYKHIEESGRKIIKQQVLIHGNALPWANASKYSELMLHQAIEDYKQMAEETDLCFFDRGIPDILGYVNLIGLNKQQTYLDAVSEYRYNPMVYILPPWEDIYKNDAERKQDFEEAIATYHIMRKIYTKSGYMLTEVPCTPLIERVKFILDDLSDRRILSQK